MGIKIPVLDIDFADVKPDRELGEAQKEIRVTVDSIAHMSISSWPIENALPSKNVQQAKAVHLNSVRATTE